jgi:hypothetical protein
MPTSSDIDFCRFVITINMAYMYFPRLQNFTGINFFSFIVVVIFRRQMCIFVMVSWTPV